MASVTEKLGFKFYLTLHFIYISHFITFKCEQPHGTLAPLLDTADTMVAAFSGL